VCFSLHPRALPQPVAAPHGCRHRLRCATAPPLRACTQARCCVHSATELVRETSMRCCYSAAEHAATPLPAFFAAFSMSTQCATERNLYCAGCFACSSACVHDRMRTTMEPLQVCAPHARGTRTDEVCGGTLAVTQRDKSSNGKFARRTCQWCYALAARGVAASACTECLF